jgi:flagellar motility protein MotE (MotC chaperone)
LVNFVDCLLFLNFAGANATLQQRLGEVQTELRAKEEECNKAAQERDRLAKKLADQADQHKAELQKLKEAEGALQAEFETERSKWVEKEVILAAGYGEIEDMIDGKLLSLE